MNLNSTAHFGKFDGGDNLEGSFTTFNIFGGGNRSFTFCINFVNSINAYLIFKICNK